MDKIISILKHHKGLSNCFIHFLGKNSSSWVILHQSIFMSLHLEMNNSYMIFVQSIVLNLSTKLISSMDIFLWVRFYPSTSISFGQSISLNIHSDDENPLRFILAISCHLMSLNLTPFVKIENEENIKFKFKNLSNSFNRALNVIIQQGAQ